MEKLEGATRIISDITLAKNYFRTDKEKSYAHLLLAEFSMLLAGSSTFELIKYLKSLTNKSPEDITLNELEILDTRAYQSWIREYSYTFKRTRFEEDLENLYKSLEKRYLASASLSS